MGSLVSHMQHPSKPESNMVEEVERILLIDTRFSSMLDMLLREPYESG